MCTYFKTEADAAQKLWLSEDPSIGRSLSKKKKKKWGYGATFWKKMEALHAELNERAEAATGSYSAEVDFLQYIYLVLVAKSH